MPAGEQPYVDTQTLHDTDVYVYETIATLEYQGGHQGGPVTRDQVFAAADFRDDTVDDSLRRLTESGVLLRTEDEAGPRYELARRDWSGTPDIPYR